ncbi:MAG: hypothetical protein V7K38_25310 [Nostoc sp.]|uniref:hypothetical protein n=1 Tax=Nostoc sp. TaxID=1180 RepID=UPI002FF8B6A9
MPYLKSKHLTTNSKRRNDESAKANRKLIYIGGKIRFQSEQDLEDYIEAYFDIIFPELVLIKRQHSLKMQRCDLLYCSKLDKQAVIIELKNEEDRGLVSQLLRYRKSILQNQSFADRIDYSLPIKLIAIAPTFHEDNYTDKEASRFEDDICFWKFHVEYQTTTPKFQLEGKNYDILYPVFGLPGSLQNEDLLSTILPAFTHNFENHLPVDARQNFRIIRELFMAQPKIKEMVSPTYRKILYGTGEGENHKKLAEITNTGKGIWLFLWLPTKVKTNIKIPLARFGFVLAANNSHFAQDSVVEWLVCTKTTVNLEENSNNNFCFSFDRHGMSKWTNANVYLCQASSNYGRNINTLDLLIYLLKGATRPFDISLLESWWSQERNTPTNLGWYIDLAIKTWNYRIK